MNFLKTKASFEIFLVVTLSIFISLSFSKVQATEVPKACCEKTTTNEYCQYTDSSLCETGSRTTGTGNYKTAPTTCDLTPFCKPNCCKLLNTEEHTCLPNIGTSSCEAQGGTPSPDCTTPDCQKGCCVVGSQCSYTTETGCRTLFRTYAPNLKYTFNEAGSEPECLSTCVKEEKGCCATKNGCKQITNEECDTQNGDFSHALCSTLPSCSCDGEKKKKCVEGTTDVYTYDSCGNNEGVTQSCDYSAGKICDESVEGAATCIDLNCNGATIKEKTGKGLWDSPAVDENKDGKFTNDETIPRKNGESWCEYDANSGPTLDLPGSRHYRHRCSNGKELADPCKGYRDEICIDMNIHSDNTPSSPSLPSARCITNRFQDCGTCDTEACCKNSDKRDCVWISPDTTTQQQLLDQVKAECDQKDEQGNPKRECTFEQEHTKGFCIPRVPPGTQFWTPNDQNTKDSNSKEQSNIPCDLSSSKEGGKTPPIVAHWEKVLEWGCHNNCIAYTPEYALTQNSFCNAQGDCGAKYNLAGVWNNEGFSRHCDKGDKDHNINDQEDPSDVEDDQVLSLPSWGGSPGHPVDGDEQAKKLLNDCKEYIPDPHSQEWKLYKGLLDFGNVYPKNFGIQDKYYAAGATVTPIIASLAVGGFMSLISPTWIFSFTTFLGLPALGIVLAVVLAAIAGIILFFGDDYNATITTTCGTWQPPSGGDYCHLCNQAGTGADGTKIDLTANGLHECTEYLCKSLGTGCEFAQTDEGGKCASKLCEGRNADRIAPLIQLSDKTKNQEACVTTNEDGQKTSCADPLLKENLELGKRTAEVSFIKANTDFTLEFETKNENREKDYTQCRIDKDPRHLYENMPTQSFLQQGFSSLHTLTLKANTDLTTGESTTYYVRCIDNCGNGKDSDPYVFTLHVANVPDIEAPLLTENKIKPENNALIPWQFTHQKVTLTLNKKVLSTPTNPDAGCRAASTDLPYQDMNIKFSCPAPSPGESQHCDHLFENIQEGSNTYFLRCKSQNNIANAQSLIPEGYTLTRTEPLNITSFSCGGTDCSSLIRTLTLALTLTTEGGAEEGKARCGLSTINVSSVDQTDFLFEHTDTSSHSIDLTLSEKTYHYYAICEDKAGNIQSTKIDFSTELDRQAPILRSVYSPGELLYVDTDENSHCSYTNEGTFDYTRATSFTLTGEQIHSTSLNGKNTFIVACKDNYENPMRLPITIYKI